MFGRTVGVDGRIYLVFCCPDTPDSEVLRRAVNMAEREEDDARDRDPDHIAYRKMLNSVQRA